MLTKIKMKNLDKMVCVLHILTMIVLIKFDFEQYKIYIPDGYILNFENIRLDFLNGYIINLNV